MGKKVKQRREHQTHRTRGSLYNGLTRRCQHTKAITCDIAAKTQRYHTQ